MPEKAPPPKHDPPRRKDRPRDPAPGKGAPNERAGDGNSAPESGKNGEDLASKAVGSGFKELGGIGKALVGVLSEANPLLALSALVVVVAAIVSLVYGIASGQGIYVGGALLGMGAFAFVVLFLYNAEQKRVANAPAVSASTSPFQLAQRLARRQKSVFMKILESAADTGSRLLGVPKDNVRANIFALDDSVSALRIVPDFMHNMDHAQEASLCIPPGEGCTGRAFSSRKPNFAVAREQWGVNAIDPGETEKLHPDLEWVISFPIFDADGNPIWTMNIDGIRDSVEPDALAGAVKGLVEWSQVVESFAAQKGTT